MKKLWLVITLATVSGLALNTLADVQNIRISGDIRLRGYYLNSAGAEIATPTFVQTPGDTQLFAQRTRVSLEADLADHVLVVVTLQADGIWGQATSLNGVNGVDRAWAVGVTEAYVQLRELFDSPTTLKVGRQALNYGTGLIISSFDQDYNFDAGRLVLDFHPLTIDLVAAQLVNEQSFAATPQGSQQDLVFINAKYEMRDQVIKDVEAYFGWGSQTGNHYLPFALANGSTTHPSPLLTGVRTDLALADGLTASLEGAYEFGNAGLPAGYAKTISAFLANVAVKYNLKGVPWAPAFNAGYTFADGGGGNLRHDFVPWFDMADGYNGYVFAPALEDIHIFNLGASVKPCANTTLAVQGYYYLRAARGDDVFSNYNADLGGPAFVNYTEGAIGVNSASSSILNSRDLGAEVDAILGYDYSQDVRCQLVYGVFIPGAHSFQGIADHVVNEVRGELTVKF